MTFAVTPSSLPACSTPRLAESKKDLSPRVPFRYRTTFSFGCRKNRRGADHENQRNKQHNPFLLHPGPPVFALSLESDYPREYGEIGAGAHQELDGLLLARASGPMKQRAALLIKGGIIPKSRPVIFVKP